MPAETTRVILGVDFSTHAIDLCMLSEDDDTAEHHRVRLDGPGKLLDRVRRVRDVMPARGAWLDLGVTSAAIEEPFGAGVAKGTMPLLVVMGAIVACLPRGITLAMLRSDDWRRECGLPLRVGRDLHKKNSVSFALEHWTGAPTVDDNAADSFCVAWALRELDRKREVRPAA